MTLRKFIYFVFYKVKCFYEELNDDGFGPLKASAIMGLLELLLSLDFMAWYAILSGSTLDIGDRYYLLIVFALFICGINYYFFLHKNKWKEYAKEFKNYPKRKNKVLGWLVLLFFLALLGSVILSLYTLNQYRLDKYP